MKQGSIYVLRAALIGLAAAVLAICIFALPAGIASDQVGAYRPILAGLYLPAIPFFIALQQTWILLGLIGRNKAFSKHAIQALRRIRNCALVISGLFAAGSPYIYLVAEQDDAPGVLALALIIIGASFAIATAAAVFQQLVQTAVAIKSENDLTV